MAHRESPVLLECNHPALRVLHASVGERVVASGGTNLARGSPVVRQQLVDPRDRVSLNSHQHIRDVRDRIDTVRLAGCDQ